MDAHNPSFADPCEPAPAQDLFRLAVQPCGSHDLLVLAGQINLDAAMQLREEEVRLAAAGRSLEVDWSRADHVGVSAIQVLLCLSGALASHGGSLRIHGDSPRVRRFLQVAGLSDRFAPAKPEEGIG